MTKTGDATYTFDVCHQKYGVRSVTAPTRFKAQIDAMTWLLSFVKGKAAGAEFYVATTIPHPDGGVRKCGKRRRRKRLYLHQLIWTLAGRPPTRQIDHRDGQPLNNAEDNLRDGTVGNQWNRGMSRNNSTGVKGISIRNGKWRVKLSALGKQYDIGSFSDIEDAKRAYNAAAKRLHGEFAVLV